MAEREWRRVIKRYTIYGRLIPLSENGIPQPSFGSIVSEQSHDVCLASDAESLLLKLDEAITLLRAVAWYDCEIGALAVGVQQWLERRGIQWANDAGTSEEWRRVVDKQTVEHGEVFKPAPTGDTDNG